MTSLERVGAWLQGIRQEIQHHRDRFRVFDTLYVGGGTPTVLPASDLQVLFDTLRNSFRFSPDVEITVEANPDDVTIEKLKFLRDLGVNRISLGVQSFDDRALQFLGRRHSARQAEQALARARRVGFVNVGVDLMYGLPGQSEQEWLEQLEHAVGFTPEHFSCYQLTLEADTPLGRMLRDGTLPSLSEESERSLFLRTSQFMEDHGYVHYEISNFARGEQYCSRHNRKYWQHIPYLGLGPAAHSFFDHTRWWNMRSVDEYCRALLIDGRPPIAESEELSAEQLRLETLFLGFRTCEGVDLQWLNVDPTAQMVGTRLVDEGLARIDHGRMRPTREGMVIADSLPLWFCE